MSLGIAGELPLTAFFRPITGKQMKENGPGPVVRKRTRKHPDEEAVLDEHPTKRTKGKAIAALDDRKSKQKSPLHVASSKRPSHFTSHTGERNVAFTYAASSPQREVIDLTELQNSDLPSPSSRIIASQILLHTPPPTTQPIRKRVLLTRPPLSQLATYSNRHVAMEQAGSTVLPPTPKSSIRRFGSRKRPMRKVVGPTTPSRMRTPSKSHQISDPLSSPLSSLPVTPFHRSPGDRDRSNGLGESISVDEDGENILDDKDIGIWAKPSMPSSTVNTSPAIARNPPTKELNLHTLPIHPHPVHKHNDIICTPKARRYLVPTRKSPTQLARTETQYVPSSQSQYMTIDDSSPRRATVDKIACSPTLLLQGDTDEKSGMSIVQSSQSQVERELTMSGGYSQVLFGQVNNILGYGHDQDEDVTHVRPEFSDPLDHTMQIFSSPKVSFDGIVVEANTQASPVSSAKRGDFDDMFEDLPTTTEVEQAQEQSQTHLRKDHTDYSATESESDGDILDFYTNLVQQHGPKSFRSHHRTSIGSCSPIETHRWPSQRNAADNSDKIVFDGAHIDISDDFSSVASSSETSQHSLPEVVKDFFDMFQGSGSYPDDFPMSLRDG